MEILVAAGADVRAEDSVGRNAGNMLAQASQGGFTAERLPTAAAILRRLVAAGLDVTARSKGDRDDSPLHEAADVGCLKLVRLMLDCCGMARAAAAADIGLLSQLVWAADGERAEEARRLLAELLQHGAPANARRPSDGATLLLTAAKVAPSMQPQHVAPLLELLLRHGADPRATSRDVSVWRASGER